MSRKETSNINDAVKMFAHLPEINKAFVAGYMMAIAQSKSKKESVKREPAHV